MAQQFTTEDRDSGFNRLLAASREMQHKPRVDAGLLVGQGADDLHEDGKTPLAVAAATNEFGTFSAGKNHNVVIPERPAWRNAFDKNQRKYETIQEAEMNRMIRGQQTVTGILHTIGGEMAGDISEEIKEGDFAPNAPSTIARKGEGKKPLTDTGLTASRISHEVRIGRAEG